ncbi:MAG: chemotaxis response regulator protein-glutamate methylesterase [Candidatus Eisenbacteria bacterium]
MAKTRVLVVDDSAVVRKILTDAFAGEPDMEVVGHAADPYVARDLIARSHPDVMTLDLEMPRMDGLTFLAKVMEHHPVPTIIVSSLTQRGSQASVEALQLGAIDVFAKPGGPHSVGELAERIKARIRAMRSGPPVRLERRAAAVPHTTGAGRSQSLTSARGLIAIGASTGGTQAIEYILTRLPADVPPIVITQHMPAGFTRAFAERLDSVCAMKVAEATNGMMLQRGTALIAPGGHHMVVDRRGLELSVRLREGPPVHHQRPAVDVMFASVARLRALPIVGVLLTGMGADGADGMVALRQAGAETLAEAEESCVVFGMPREAIARGGASSVVSLLQMPTSIADAMERLNRAKVA